MLPSNFCWFCTLILLFRTAVSVQNYDNSSCRLTSPASSCNNQCSKIGYSCETFVVYRAQKGYNTLGSVAALFSSTIDDLLTYNNFSLVDPNLLQTGYEIIIPTACSCPQDCTFCRAVYTHNASHSSSLSAITCGTFEGLAITRSLGDCNSAFKGENQTTFSLQVPVKCACPNSSDIENGVVYLVTYPVFEYDSTDLIALKFHVPEETLREVNGLEPFDAIFPQTTLFIPLSKQPYLSPALLPSPPDSPASTVVLNPNSATIESKGKKYNLNFVAVVCAVMFLMVIMYIATISVWNKSNQKIVKSFPATSSSPSNFSQDFLDGMTKLKHSFTYFSLEELMIATRNFDEASLIGPGIFRGKFGDSELAIKQVSSREVATNIICILTKISHLNVVKLEGYYDGTLPYLVFELAENGSLRDCLSSSRLGKALTWRGRIQIAFDLAVGLCYLHHCTKPTYVHRNINSGNVLVTADWRAKISGFGSAKPVNEEEKGGINSRESAMAKGERYLAPEYLKYGQDSTKVDVYAFGVVLLELLSGKEANTNGKVLKSFPNAAANRELHRDPSSCSESLERFVDPVLERDYPVDGALFLACLAKGCMEEDPLDRPTMNDVLRALSRLL